MHGLLRISLVAVVGTPRYPDCLRKAFRDETRDHRGVLLFT